MYTMTYRAPLEITSKHQKYNSVELGDQLGGPICGFEVVGFHNRSKRANSLASYCVLKCFENSCHFLQFVS